MAEPIPYIPGLYPKHSEPLSRFLPPIPDGVVKAYLESSIPFHSLILDPFGTFPNLAIEAARSGYRVIVTANNPIARFLLEMSANPAPKRDLEMILADIAATRSVDERLETQIRNLYLSQCNNCGSEIEVKAFIWERDLNIPTAKQYYCAHCGKEEIQPATEFDTNRALEFATDKLHRNRALERVASLDDPDRPHVEEALETYLPRTLYALITLINRMDRLALTKERRRQLEMLFISTFDTTNSLWAYPTGRSRPRLLSLSPRYWENNVWMALENAASEWAPEEDEFIPPISLNYWPDLPSNEGGITIYEGRLKELVDPLQELGIQGIIGAFPRPNQAYWTLSALWSGWLWGKEAVRPFKSVLRRRRYDWNWHTSALASIFENLSEVVKIGVPFFGLIAEAEPGFLSAALIATELSGFAVDKYAIRADSSLAQFIWQKDSINQAPRMFSPQHFQTHATSAALDYLSEKAEPCSYTQIHTAALIRLAEQTHFFLSTEAESGRVFSPSETISQVSTIIEQSFSYRAGLLHYGGSNKSLEVGRWGLRPEIDTSSVNKVPLADKIEMELVRYILKNPGASLLAIDSAICRVFSGLLTPGGEFISVCLESYAVERPETRDQWYLRKDDMPQTRRTHIENIRQTLAKIAEKLNYRSEGERPILWFDENSNLIYALYILASATYGEIVLSNPYPPNRSVIVLPGSRANLTLYKQKRNSQLQQIIKQGWLFVKFRHIYRILENPMLNRENFAELLSMDPLQDAKLQMRLL